MSYGAPQIQGTDPTNENNFQSQNYSPLPGMTEDEFIKLAASILVVIPHRQNEGIRDGIANHFGVWARFGTPFALVRDPHGGFVETLRAGICRTFVDYNKSKPHVRFVVMIDNDESIEWDAPYRLAAWNKEVVSGVVCAYNSKRGVFGCFTIRDKGGIPRFPSYLYTRKMPASGLVEAAHVGGGLLCIRMDVMDRFIYELERATGPCPNCAKIEHIPFAIPTENRLSGLLTGDLKKGEDITFSEQCERYGIKRWVDLSVRAAHHKELPLQWPAEDIDPDLAPEDWVVSDSEQSG